MQACSPQRCGDSSLSLQEKACKRPEKACEHPDKACGTRRKRVWSIGEACKNRPLETLAGRAILIQAKTYYGGGKWYPLDLDYQRIGRIMRQAGYHGYISLEFEGQADPMEAVPKSLELLRESFYFEI